MGTVHGPGQGRQAGGAHSPESSPVVPGEAGHPAASLPPGALPPDWNPYTGPYHHDDVSGGSSARSGSVTPGSVTPGGDGPQAPRHGGHPQVGPAHPPGVGTGRGGGLRHRVRRRLHPFRSAIKGFAVGLTVGLICLGGALATGLLDPAPILQVLRGGAGGGLAAGPQDELERDVIAACTATLARTDCRCFWGQTRAVWTPGNVSEVMQALTERNRYAGQLTRVKLDRLIGEDANRQVMQALIQCLQ